MISDARTHQYRAYPPETETLSLVRRERLASLRHQRKVSWSSEVCMRLANVPGRVLIINCQQIWVGQFGAIRLFNTKNSIITHRHPTQNPYAIDISVLFVMLFHEHQSSIQHSTECVVSCFRLSKFSLNFSRKSLNLSLLLPVRAVITKIFRISVLLFSWLWKIWKLLFVCRNSFICHPF